MTKVNYLMFCFVLFRFLTMLEDEVYGTSSPIWDPEFSQTNVPNSPPQATGKYLKVELSYENV